MTTDLNLTMRAMDVKYFQRQINLPISIGQNELFVLADGKYLYCIEISQQTPIERWPYLGLKLADAIFP